MRIYNYYSRRHVGIESNTVVIHMSIYVISLLITISLYICLSYFNVFSI